MKSLRTSSSLLLVGFFLTSSLMYLGLQKNFLPFLQTTSKPLITAALNSNRQATTSAVLGAQTKTSDCVALGVLPDPSCTPGAIFSDVTKDQICTPGYTQTVRDVPLQLKDEIYAEYGIEHHTKGEYEVDHYISLELGGSNNPANLWPEPAEPRPGFHEKDEVENYLHDQVCSGHLTLQVAQQQISTNWLAVYHKFHP